MMDSLHTQNNFSWKKFKWCLEIECQISNKEDTLFNPAPNYDIIQIIAFMLEMQDVWVTIASFVKKELLICWHNHNFFLG